jgi:metallo-beta-lactamase class B
MKKAICILLLFITGGSNAQFSVRLILTDIATRKYDEVYLSGNFNNWNPRDENYRLKPFGGSRKSVVLKDLPAGTYAFKFTRGGFDKVECTADGRDISDRILEVNADISQEFTIAGWKDDYPETPRKYTASPQVKIIDTAFSIPQLNRTRRIWVYLPKGYASTSKNYPVIYMNDGQNLFNLQTAAFGEWGVDECLDTLQKKTGKECIIVGIDHGGEKRMREYNPYDNVQFGKGEGKEYAAFLANTLKPFIDGRFRTKKGPENNFIAGSSMGGLISLYTVIHYPEIFGGAGVFSPSLSLAPFLYSEASMFSAGNTTPRFYLYAGAKESTTMVADLQRMSDILEKKPNHRIRKVTNPLGQHNENYWRQEFAFFYTWIMNE